MQESSASNLVCIHISNRIQLGKQVSFVQNLNYIVIQYGYSTLIHANNITKSTVSSFVFFFFSFMFCCTQTEMFRLIPLER